MLNNIPAELLLHILSFLAAENSTADTLSALSRTNHYLSATTREYRAQLLRTRLHAMPHIETLVKIWNPPLFFKRYGGSGQSSGGYAAGIRDLHDLLCDESTFSQIDKYLHTLERIHSVSGRVADYIVTLIDFNHLRTPAEKKHFAQACVLELWSFQVRYGHDVDGYIMGLREDYGPEYYLRDSYVRSLPPMISSGVLQVYGALSQYLRPPFYPSQNRSEGLWLHRYILRDGMETVLAMLESKGR